MSEKFKKKHKKDKKREIFKVLQMYNPDDMRSETFKYNKPAVRLVKKKEYSDETWDKYEYDDYGNRIKKISSDGSWVTYQYDKSGKCIRKENSQGRIKIYYYRRGKLVWYIVYDGKFTLHAYDRKDRLIMTKDLKEKE